MAYTFRFDETKLPVPPESLNLKINNQNKTINLINEGEVNLLKTPGLTDVSFSFLIPTRERSFTQDLEDADFYLGLVEDYKIQAKPFQFIVYRETEGGEPLFDTNMTVSMEDYEIDENADNLYDVVINVNLKQYRKFGTKMIKIKNNKAKVEPAKKDSNSGKKDQSYTVKSGDTLWAISKKFYKDPLKWKKIYDANKSVIESVAKKHGLKSSSTGHWIFPSTKLKIPK